MHPCGCFASASASHLLLLHGVLHASAGAGVWQLEGPSSVADVVLHLPGQDRRA